MGIDGGGTKTTCIVGDDHAELARAEVAGSNVIRVGEDAARSALGSAISGACAKANIGPAKITRTVAGIAGVGTVDVRQFLSQALSGIVSGEVRVVSDAEIALYAALGDSPGIVVIAGTGSIALGQDSSPKDKRKTARAGGWGWAISDEGSGPSIGRAAVAAILQARDRGTIAQLEQLVLHSWQVENVEQLVRRANAIPPPDFGALLHEVVVTADSGDNFATAILAHAGYELANLAEIAAVRLFPPATTIQVAMSGGVFAHAPQVREAFTQSLQTELPNAAVRPELCDPALGALQMARLG